ncbi:RNA polymerase subunit sigma-24 [Wenyingzhuangia fucanilytica]|uniref:RNA polymerase subunit sigma-24 n=1 Tax=Wenyingzhuangia fucanilytica TaxID=1790137 RepID=A0A1B1Y5A5_9FLAO|nr:sigma-70 family RNA polymerase sigma factor [Wenyingzhuangia fucanilytica]ANW95918.1 RNA polymerase subunit sigma-24 [Wenyingzhuangia fucanilytica]
MDFTPKHSDAVLVSMYIKGNEDCLSELISRHQEKIFGYIYSKTFDKELSDDLFQDTFIKIIHTLKRGKYNEEGKFLPWALRIAHNLTMDYYRDKKRKKTKYASENYDVFDFLAAEDLNAEDKIELEQTLNKITNLIDFLPADQQEVLRMRIFMDSSFKEIAEHTNVSINTALGRMRYALINLRKILEEKEVVKNN